MLKSILLQIAQSHSLSRKKFVDAYEKANSSGCIFDRDEMMKLLASLTEVFKSVYIVIDALDECTERGEVFDFLEELQGRQLPQVRVLLSSKTMEEIEDAFKKLTIDKIFVESNVVDVDIKKHIEFQLKNNRALREKWNDDEQRDIEDKITSSSNGRYVELTVCSKRRNVNIEAAFNGLLLHSMRSLIVAQQRHSTKLWVTSQVL